MPWIDDPDLAKAVDLACWLIRTGKQIPPKAIFIAARKYDFDTTTIAQHVSARGAEAQKYRKRRNS